MGDSLAMATNYPCNSTLTPRRYQEEIFIKAQESNVIAALDTGSGKTFISSMLMRWMSSREYSRGKFIAFLVPKVPLVEQQADFIAKQTPLKVCRLHGMLEIDMTDHLRWRKVFAQHDVVVMTAQIFLNLLTHAHVSFGKVSLMVFDECHHTRKNHPYNGIMREYFQVPSGRRPKVFGMTASPIWNPKDAQGSILTLEQNLDANVIAVRVHTEELENHAPKPREITKVYDPAPEEYTYPSPTLLDCLSVFDLWAHLDVPWSNIQFRYQATRAELGPYCAELFLYDDIKHRVRQALESDHCSPNTEDCDHDVEMQPPRNLDLLEDLLHIDSILKDFDLLLQSASGLDLPPPLIPVDWCSPKVKALVDILAEHMSPNFQGIVFVEQRQVAACLARVLPCFPALTGLVRCAELVGQTATDHVKGMNIRQQTDIVRSFRDGAINLLIATSVAEEGLDFPACDVVVRFDELRHMVGYLQSRGRARRRDSTYIIMVQTGHETHLARYQVFMESEPELRRVYQSRGALPPKGDDFDEDDEDTGPVDLAERERYLVNSTGAVLTYDNSIGLLNYLCSLIPVDPYTPVAVPTYTGDFDSVLHLPPSLPLSPSDLCFRGPRKQSKKEAKRAVAFIAVKRLHELAVFDDHLLPVWGRKATDEDLTQGCLAPDVSPAPELMDVMVRDPWTTGETLWSHTVYVDGQATVGIITGTRLPPVQLRVEKSLIETARATRICFDEGEEVRQRDMLDAYTKLGISICNTGSPIPLPLSCFLVPLDQHHQPDFAVIEGLLDNPWGSNDWSSIGPEHNDRLLILNSHKKGWTYLLRQMRHDLTPMSAPPLGSRESTFTTYYDYYMERYLRKNRPGWQPQISVDSPLVEVCRLDRNADGNYELDGQTMLHSTVRDGAVFSQCCCRWLSLPMDVFRAFLVLPQLCRRFTDVYRAHQAKFELGLPAIVDDILVEALTLPLANARWSNQRLETLGDSVLKLATTVQLFNQYPHRHEGQLAPMRQVIVSNRALMARAKMIELERFLTSEPQIIMSWRYVGPTRDDKSDIPPATHAARRTIPRRSLQDCMEATLGAAFLTGGIPMALHTAEALGLGLGGRIPWCERYGRHSASVSTLPLFFDLQERLGYTFRRGDLLIEAVTHPSFCMSAGSASYQRLEFLGDALIDMVVIHYIFGKFPNATPEQLTRLRSRAVCASALAVLAVRRLRVHKLMLVNNVELSEAIGKCVPLLEAASEDQVVNEGWRLDPPKPVSDVFESIMGAILIDCGWDYDQAALVVEFVMADLLDALSGSSRANPVTELTEWAAKSGCRRLVFEKVKMGQQSRLLHGIKILVHEVLVAGPVTSSSAAVAKNLASEQALQILKDKASQNALSHLCDCGQPLRSDVRAPEL